MIPKDKSAARITKRKSLSLIEVSNIQSSFEYLSDSCDAPTCNDVADDKDVNSLTSRVHIGSLFLTF